MSTCEKWPSGSSKRPMRGAKQRAVRLMLALLLVTVTVLAIPAAYAQPSSEQPVVELTVAEADSILARIDQLEVRVWELNRLSQLDSLYYEERLELVSQTYEEIVKAYKDEQPNWLERLAKQPVIWLALGMYIGVQANVQ